MKFLLSNRDLKCAAEEMKCTDAIKHLKNENSSESTIIKIVRKRIHPDE